MRAGDWRQSPAFVLSYGQSTEWSQQFWGKCKSIRIHIDPVDRKRLANCTGGLTPPNSMNSGSMLFGKFSLPLADFIDFPRMLGVVFSQASGSRSLRSDRCMTTVFTGCVITTGHGFTSVNSIQHSRGAVSWLWRVPRLRLRLRHPSCKRERKRQLNLVTDLVPASRQPWNSHDQTVP